MPPRSDFEKGVFCADNKAYTSSSATSNASQSLVEGWKSSSSSSLLPSKTAQVTAPKKQVSFYPSVQVNPALHINDYLVSEIIDTWYDHSEMSKMKEDCRRTVVAMESGTQTDDENSCRRGLEGRTREGAQRKHQMRIAAWDAVLDAVEDGSSPESMADLYHFYALPSEMMARRAAIFDAGAVQKSCPCSSTKALAA